MKEKFLAQYFEFYKNFETQFWNTDGCTYKILVEWKKCSFGVIRQELIQFRYKIGP